MVTDSNNSFKTLLVNYLSNENTDSSSPLFNEIVGFTQNKNEEVIVEAVKDMLKKNKKIQLRVLELLDSLFSIREASLAKYFSTEKWGERVVKLCKEGAPDLSFQKCVITFIVKWNANFPTAGFQRVIEKIGGSKRLGPLLAEIQSDFIANQAACRNSAKSESIRHIDPAALGNYQSDLSTATPQITTFDVDNLENFLLAAQSDLAALEYSLEHPQMMDDEVVQQCIDHKENCLRLLRQSLGIPSEYKSSLQSLKDQIELALELHSAISSLDGGLGSTRSNQSNNNLQGNEGRISDFISNVNPCREVEKTLLNAQQETATLLDNGREERRALQQELDEVKSMYENLRNKYQEAKVKNKKAVEALTAYAERVDELESLQLSGSSPALLRPSEGFLQTNANGEHKLPYVMPISDSGILPISRIGKQDCLSTLTEGFLLKYREQVSNIRASLRVARKEFAVSLRNEHQARCQQLQMALRSVMAAVHQERKSDKKALQWINDLYKKEIKLRKQYYNAIQELKGNIRVYCRVRPLEPGEVKEGHKMALQFPSEDELQIYDQNGRLKLFGFEKVFRPDATQEKVFEDIIPLIASVVDGYNVCIFAYGQTGSGKTHTMNGSNDSIFGEKGYGLCPRSLACLFDTIQERKEYETTVVSVSIIEIYCDQIIDLFVDPEEAAQQSYEVRQGGPYGSYITNISEHVVQNAHDIDVIFQKAKEHRSEAGTRMNEHSSRSHMILTVFLNTTNAGLQTFGKLSLVDLAGSERLEKSQSEGQRAKEAISINKSLTALGDVISGLGQSKSKHIPYRNSILTYVLKDSMCGQAKVLMFCCVSPSTYNVNETISSLTFATRVRGVTLGPAAKNTGEQ